MIARQNLIEIGIFKKTHGIDGEISASIDCELDILKHFTCLVCEVDGIFVPFFIESMRYKSSETTLLKIDGIDNEKDATLLVNKPIYVFKSEFHEQLKQEDSDHFPLDYFIGFKVKDRNKELGEIIDVDDSTANVLFVVDHNGRQLLLPAVDDLIDDINLNEKYIDMAIPPELLNL